jgi:hypothetical protein
MSLIYPPSKNDTPLCSTMAHLSTKQAERYGKQQYSYGNSSLLAKTLCIADLEHPRSDSIQETKRRNILQSVD